MKKKIIANILYYTGVLFVLFKIRLYTTNIRAVNYHCTPFIDIQNFNKHLKFYSKYFENIDLNLLNKSFNKLSNKNITKPGIILSFDDGLRSNFDYALPILESYKYTGWFFIPYGFLIDNSINFVKKNSILIRQTYDDNRYGITIEELKHLNINHIIGSHTFSHHRFKKEDTEDILIHEIEESKKKLSNTLDMKIVDIFCWVGGELSSYTKQAYDKIALAGYKYAFTTNNLPISRWQNKLNLNRTNIESYYSIPEVMFQLSGIMDIFYYRKRKKVKNIFEQDVIN